MNRKVIIASDSTCDLSPELIKEYDVKIIPLYINFENESYKDNLEINLDQLYQKVQEKNEMPKTSTVPPKEFHDFFKKFVDEGYDVFYTGIGSELSSTFQTAVIVSEDFDGHVVCVDSGNLSTGIGLLVLKACTFRDQGMNVNEIAEKVSDIVPRLKVQFVVETLEYLHKGIEEGSNCFGFHSWTPIDCWSWSNAYKNRYGYIAVDIARQIKTIKKSGRWIKKVAENNGF